MKIIIVTDAWEPQVNGVVTVLKNIIPLLEKKCFEVTIIHPGLFMKLSALLFPDVKLSLVNIGTIHSMIKKTDPDYVHIVTEGPIGFAVRSYCLLKKIKFTTSYHTNFHQYVKMRVGKAFEKPTYDYMRWFHNTGEHTMVANQSLKNDLEDHDFKNVILWPLGVDSKLYKRNPNAPKRDEFIKPIFVYFGRIAKEKNIEEYLTCKLPGTKLVIGDGPLMKELKEDYKDATFVGFKKGQELIDLLSISDVCVFPSRTETLGLIVLESLACELPVAAHDVMGPKDVISSGVDGYLDENLERAALACLQIEREKCRQKAFMFSWKNSAEIFAKNLVSAKKTSA